VLTPAALPGRPKMNKNLFADTQSSQVKGERTMNQDHRVLARTQARILTEKEIQAVSGGIHTETKCTVLAGNFADGDRGEC